MTDGELVKFQHVHDAHLSYGTAKQLRPLVHAGRWGRRCAVRDVLHCKYEPKLCQSLGYVPTSKPPLEPPFIVSLDGDVYPSLMRYSAAHWKSVKQFCLLASMPAEGDNMYYTVLQIYPSTYLRIETARPCASYLCARSPRTPPLLWCWRPPEHPLDVWRRWVGRRCSLAWWRC